MVFSYLIALFVAMPLIELWVLVTLGNRIGWLETIALVFVTGVIGAWLARAQGFQTLVAIQRDMANEIKAPEKPTIALNTSRLP